MRDPYKILGVKKSASDAEVKKAYRTLAKDLHPDKNPDDEAVAEKFKEVSAAYSILGDKERRAKFDRGEIDSSGAEQNPFAGAGGAGFEDVFGNRGFGARSGGFGNDDLFSELFGFSRGQGRRPGQRQQAPLKGQDVTYQVTVGFMDAAKGAVRRVTLEGGKALDVKVPAGVQTGQQIKLSGQGRPGSNKAPSGDALIKITVADHPFFNRDGLNINLELPITVDEAIMGATISVPTIAGKVSLKIPKNSSSGRRLRLKGKGIHKGKQTGDQYVSLKIVLPEKPDAALEKAISEWRQANAYAVRAELTED